MGRRRTKRKPAESSTGDVPVQVPAVLPHLVFTVHPDGTMTVTVDGEPHEPPAFAPPWRREAFASILDDVTDERRTPVRVEVREADGSRFTEIVTPARRRRPAPEPESPPPTLPGLAVLHGAGFVPGEDIAIAVVVGHTDAAPTGTARALIETTTLDGSPTGEVILLGRVSGTFTIGRPR